MKKSIVKGIVCFSFVMTMILNTSIEALAIINNEKNINFKKITTENGLSQTSVQYIFQDSKGYMWIGTIDGLNKYNGNKFEVYRYNKEKDTSISGNYVTAINEDSKGNIWVGTSRGVNKIDAETKKIESYLPGVDGCNISDHNVTEILIGKDKRIYVATTNGVNVYDEDTNNFINLYPYDKEKGDNNLTSQFIYSIIEDNDNNMWVGTVDGLNRVNKETGEITKFYKDSENLAINDNFIYKLFIDDLNNLWIGTDDGGVNKLDLDTYTIESYTHDENNPNSIAGNSIRYILKDSRDILWFGTDNGLSRMDKGSTEFVNYESNVFDNQSLVSNDILSLFEDESGTIWVGTYDGISLFNMEAAFKNYRNNPMETNSLSSNMMAGIYEDNDGLLWVGTVSEGINVIDRKNGKFLRHQSSDNDNSLSNNNIRDITGIDNEIWIATEEGLAKYDKNTKKFTDYFQGNDKNSLISNDIRSLYIDDKGILWIATKDGICSFDRDKKFTSYRELFLKNGIRETMFSDIIQDKDGVFWIASTLNGGLISMDIDTDEVKIYRNNEEDDKSISFNAIKSIAVDSENNIWIGTQYGLNKLDKERKNFTRYTEEDGLANNFIYGVLVDEDDNVWMSTNSGISKFDITNGKFINYDVTDGLQGNEFNGFSYYKNKSGEMFFGGVNGLTYFNPLELKEQSYLPKVQIDSIYSNDNEYIEFENINLSYKNSNIQFNFFLPDYRNVVKIQYAYKLAGLDEEWVMAENRSYASYTNLDAGTYTFMVKARNKSGDWSDPETVTFTVRQKPWKTPLAYITYGITLFLVIYLIWNRVKILDSLVDQRTYELNNKLKENKELYDKLITIEKYKNNYFVNLSHELRTPLNVIISIEQLLSKLSKDKKEVSKEKLEYYMSTLRRNSDRLLNLINNIIDTSKIESGSYKLIIKEHDIVYLVEEIVLSMKDYIEANGIELIIDPDVEEKIIECDKNEIEKCVINLVGNAIKFTEKGGKIEVKIADLGDSVRISIKDTGIGIDKSHYESIFDRFGQAYNNISEEYGGSGLGLTLTKQLVTLHNGSIYVKSEVGVGSEFIIILPVRQG